MLNFERASLSHARPIRILSVDEVDVSTILGVHEIRLLPGSHTVVLAYDTGPANVRSWSTHAMRLSFDASAGYRYRVYSVVDGSRWQPRIARVLQKGDDIRPTQIQSDISASLGDFPGGAAGPWNKKKPHAGVSIAVVSRTSLKDTKVNALLTRAENTIKKIFSNEASITVASHGAILDASRGTDRNAYMPNTYMSNFDVSVILSYQRDQWNDPPHLMIDTSHAISNSKCLEHRISIYLDQNASESDIVKAIDASLLIESIKLVLQSKP